MGAAQQAHRQNQKHVSRQYKTQSGQQEHEREHGQSKQHKNNWRNLTNILLPQGFTNTAIVDSFPSFAQCQYGGDHHHQCRQHGKHARRGDGFKTGDGILEVRSRDFIGKS